MYLCNTSDKDYLKIIDPACGSGTFLTEAILQINEIASGTKINQDGKVYGFIKDRKTEKRIEDSIFGLELNPLSKSIADINLFFSMIQAYGNYTNSENIDLINIYRTNSLEINNNFKIDNDIEEKLMFVKDEIRNSRMYKYNLLKAKNQKYDIIVGNPPYGSTKGDSYIQNTLIPFALPEHNFDAEGNNTDFHKGASKGKVPKHEKNIGKLNDLYAYFFGLSDTLCRDNGIIAYITSNTYLTIPTYKWLRKYLLQNYTIDYLINFNEVSEKTNSMFFPDAGIATNIIIMRKTPPSKNHVINVLDLSKNTEIKDKFEAFSEINWVKTNSKVNKNHIKDFKIKPLEKINFKHIPQKDFLTNKNYTFSLKEHTEKMILDKIASKGELLSTNYKPSMGVDVGDLIFVQKNEKNLKTIFNKVIIHKDFSLIKKTLKSHLISQFSKNNIDTIFDKDKVVKFLYQKDMQAYTYDKVYYTYLDKNILWRARIDGKVPLHSNPIFSKEKLLILERRDKEKIVTSVTDELLVPQHGGRFMYISPSKDISVDELYLLSGIINSNVTQFYYRYRSLGNKDIIIPKLRMIDLSLKNEIISLSKKVHELMYERNRYLYVEDNLYSKNGEIIKANILNTTNYWSVKFEDSLVIDYTVENIEKESDKIILNDAITIFPSNGTDISNLYSLIKDYKGHLIDSPLIVDIYKMKNISANYIEDIRNQVNTYFDNINILTAEIYKLSSKDLEIVNNSN
ncbi:hypothetical protein ERX27_03580 [Macrococcus brunensis]|uniref:site-specific DNA-methyltransferase (adenine-specific) n=1 Tax=Macrococcus brunensis TaxID=198483 RepID=A0A4R6BFG2_9STAP|nr:N-6 DNA methylase [Macrococcus brunensis]TDL98530.1 hypothetical protein ERX27_03580 [Macrococcus brunensis]